MEKGNEFEIMLGAKKKKGKDAVLKHFHSKKEDAEFSIKKDLVIRDIQRFCLSYLSNKRLYETL
jgi:hypothetical protein